MTSKGLTSALLLASMFAATSGCLQQNALTQGYRTTQPGQPGQAQVASANTPCTPSANLLQRHFSHSQRAFHAEFAALGGEQGLEALEFAAPEGFDVAVALAVAVGVEGDGA